MTDNLVHLVLARTPDAPEGVRGISLFLVPKFLINADGSLGERNDVHRVSIEHKLGIHASPTCVMSFGDKDGAIGWLVGQENKGLAHMFTNDERGPPESRLAGSGHRRAGLPGGARLCQGAGSGPAGGAEERQSERRRRQARVDLLIPVLKGWCTDLGVEIASLGVQIFGGMGFIEETGACQYLRDARIAPIYKGTTGIQAADLVGRKLPTDKGAAMAALIGEMRAVEAHRREVEGTEFCGYPRCAGGWDTSARAGDPMDAADH